MGERVNVYWLFWPANGGGARLEKRSRDVTGKTTGLSLGEALVALLSGPTVEELRLELTTEIPRGTKLRGLNIEGDVAVIDLSAELESGGGSLSMLGRIAQIVYTATDLPAIKMVRIQIEGQFRSTLGGEGVLLEGLLDRSSIPGVF